MHSTLPHTLIMGSTQYFPAHHLSFFRENFLAVDIFFAQLKYERTEQIKAYTIEVFLGE